MSFTFRRDFDIYLKRAKPTLPDDMRRLIDEAVAVGRITRVPQGASSMPYPVWCPKAKALVEVDPKTAVEKNREAMLRGQRASVAVRVENGRKTRDEIAALAAHGMKAADIIAATKLSHTTVMRHLRAIGVGPEDHVDNLLKFTEQRVAATKARQNLAVELADQGMPVDAIAERIGVKPKVVKRYLRNARAADGQEVAA